MSETQPVTDLDFSENCHTCVPVERIINFITQVGLDGLLTPTEVQVAQHQAFTNLCYRRRRQLTESIENTCRLYFNSLPHERSPHSPTGR